MKSKLTYDRNGIKIYKLNGLYHREDGPTLDIKGEQYWFLNDKMVNVNSQEEFEKSKEYKLWKLRAFI